MDVKLQRKYMYVTADMFQSIICYSNSMTDINNLIEKTVTCIWHQKFKKIILVNLLTSR